MNSKTLMIRFNFRLAQTIILLALMTVFSSNIVEATFTQKSMGGPGGNGIVMSSNGQYQANYGSYNGSGGIHISSNYGNSWSTGYSGNTAGRLLMSTSGQYQFIDGYSNGAMYSTNYGASWSSSGHLSRGGSAMSGTGQYIITSSWFAGSLYRSTNYGASFSQLQVSVNDEGSAAVSSTGQYMVYGSGRSSDVSGPMYYSSDYGATWNSSGTSDYWREATMSDSGQYVMATSHFSSSGSLYVSTNYGASWTNKLSSLNGSSIAMSSNGQYQYLKSGTTLYKSINFGSSFSSISTSFNGGAVAVSDDGSRVTIVYNGDAYVSTDYGVTFYLDDLNIAGANSVAMSSSGQYQSIGGSNCASCTGYVYVSIDYADVQTAPIWSGTASTNSITNNSANLVSSFNPDGNTTTGWVRYSTSNPGTCNDSFGTREPASGGSNLGSGTADSQYTRSLSGLSTGTQYWWCPIASNAIGTTINATPQTFTTSSVVVPTLASPPSQAGMTNNVITLGGNVTSNGGAALSARGVCYSLTSNDSTPGFTTAGGSTPESNVTCTNEGSTTTGVFTIPQVTGLTPNGAYSFRAFARNSVGNGYSNVGSFEMDAAPTVTTSAAGSITATQASLNSIVSPNNASTNISYLWGTAPGVACNLQPNTLPGPTNQTGNSNISPNSTTLGSLSSNTTYYFCVMATNTYGTTYGTVLNFDSLTSNPSSYGYMDAGSALGSGATDCDDATGAPCPPSLNSIGSATQTSLTANWTAWAASAGPQPTSYNLFYCDRTSNGSCTPNIQIGGSISSGATSYAHNSGITCNRNYAYILRAVNAIGSSSDSTVRTGSTSSCASAPSVTTSAASGQTTTTAILNSTINPNNDTTSITYRWQTGSTATCNGSTPTNTLAGPSGLTGGNPLSGATTQQTLTGLTAGTRYYYCATATNSISPFTTYGTVQNFWTLPNAPTSPSATKQGNGLQINVNYSNVTGATGYNIYACSGASCTPTFLTSYGGTTYQHTGLSCGTTYRYQVAATNSAGEGAKTSIFSATTTSGGTLTCYQDTDTDGYAPAGASTTTMCGSCSSGYTSTQPTTGGANGNIDCYDGNGSARPNNPSAGCGIYYGTRGDGSGDYDCNGTTSICGGGNSCNSTFQFYQSGDFGCTSPVTLCSSLGGSATQCGQTTWGSTQGYCGYGYVPTCGSLTCTYSGAPLQGQLSCY